jgi:hypothetical protein
MALAAGSLALAASLVAGPAALAQDGPEATIEGFLAAVEAKDFEALPTYFCAEFADQVADFDISSLVADLPEGTDPQSILDAFVLDAEIETLELVSETDTEAIVKLVGTLSMSVDTAALGPLVEGLLAASGVEVTPDMVEMMMGLMAEEFATTESTVIDEEITLAPGEMMPWVICDELGSEPEASPAASDDAGMEADPMAEPEASPAS